MMMITERFEIASNTKLAENTYLMALNAPDIVNNVTPGQFVMIRVTDGLDPLLRRPFSVCGLRKSDLLLILYRVAGKGTAILSEKGKGDRLSVLGPLGKGFVIPPDEKTSLLVAGGIGVAPLIFLAQRMRDADTRMLVGYRSGSELLPMGNFALDTMEVRIATEDGSKGHHGMVTDLLANELEKDAIRLPNVYACGPAPMLKKVATMGFKRGFPCQVSLEAFMACGLGACQGCAVKAAPGQKHVYDHVCQDGPVFQNDKVDWKSL
jgi:dihydroorotate dehydrogenase electron transfer subunit